MLPVDDTDLENTYGAHDYENIAVDDGVRVTQCATDEYTLHLFKDKHTNSIDGITVTWNGQSDLAPSSSTVYLQIYNKISGIWETLDSDNVTAADTDFNLTGARLTNLNNYYDASNWIACRVYQEAG